MSGDGSLLGTSVEIRSAGGISYRGVIEHIGDRGSDGELFVLGDPDNDQYQRLVYVHDRQAQISEL